MVLGCMRMHRLPIRALQCLQACAWLFCGNFDLKLGFFSDTVGQPYPCSVINISPMTWSEKWKGPSAVLCLCIAWVLPPLILGDSCLQLPGTWHGADPGCYLVWSRGHYNLATNEMQLLFQGHQHPGDRPSPINSFHIGC